MAQLEEEEELFRKTVCSKLNENTPVNERQTLGNYEFRLATVQGAQTEERCVRRVVAGKNEGSSSSYRGQE